MESPHEKMSQALQFLAETDGLEAHQQMECLKAETRWKETKQAMFLTFSGTVAEREALASQSAEAQAALVTYLGALQAHRETDNKRKTWMITIDVCRTEISAKKAGVDI